MEREIFRAHIEISSTWRTTRGIIQLVCKSQSLKLRTLQTCDIVNQNGESVKSLQQGLEIETRHFELFKVGQSDLAAAAAVDVGTAGYIPLVQRSRQNVDLSTDTQNRSVIRIYKSEKNFAKKAPDKELTLAATAAYPKKETLSFKFSVGGDDYDVKLINEDEYQVMYYLISRSRTLTDQERMTRMIGKGYNNTAAVKEAFDNVVLKRLAPSQRAAYANLDFKEMLQKLDYFNEMISSRDIHWYIKSLKKPNVAVTDFGWLNGALRDADTKFLEQFVAENGMQLIISAVEKQRKSAQVYQVFIVALECLEAIIDKPKTEDTAKFGMEYVFGNENALDFICEQLDHLNHEVRLKVVLLLETMLQFCLEPPVADLSPKYQAQMLEVCETGKDKMLAALERRAESLRKPNMWHVFLQQIQDELKRKRASKSKMAKIKMQYMADIVSLINIIIVCYPEVERRIKQRSELEHAGFMELLDQLKEEKDQLAKNANCKDKDREAIESFEYEIEEFEERRNDDKRIAMFDDDVDLTNIHEVFEFLLDQCKNNGAANDLGDIFRYLLLIPVGQEFRPLWRTCVDIIRDATKRAKTFSDDQEGQNYDTLYHYLVDVLEKRAKGNDPVSLINKKQAEIDQLHDEVANLKYELEEVKKGGTLFSSLSSATLRGSSTMDLISVPSGVLPAGVQPVAMAPAVPKPTLDDSLKSLFRMLKIGAPDAKLREIMAKKGFPKDNWDANIKTVRDYKAALDAWNAAGGENQQPVPVKSAPPAPAMPKPTLPEDLMFLYKSMKMGAPESRLKNTMAMRKIPKEKWDENISKAKKYMEDLKAFEAGGPPPAAAAPPARPAPVVPEDLKKYVKLLKMGRPESNVKQAMAMARMPKEKFKEAMEWFEKVKAHEAGAPPAMPGGAVQAKPPPPEIPADLKKFVRFFKMKLPESTIKQKMTMQKMGDRFDECKECWEKQQAYKAKYPDDGSAPAPAAAAPSSGSTPSSGGMVARQKERKQEKKKPKGPDYETDLWKSVNSTEFALPDMGIFAPRARRKPRPVSNDQKQEVEEEVEAKEEVTSLIYDPKILQNLGVFLPKLRRAGVSFTTLQQNIWNLSGLNEEMLSSLLSVLEIGDAEWLNIKQNKAPPEMLDENSKMYDKLKNIPRITQRIKHCLFKENFERRKKDIMHDLQVVQKALDEVKNSKSFPLLLHCIFQCFKANQPKQYKEKKGFPIRLLTSVNKKKITKPDGTETTWLYYIFETFHKDNPEALGVIQDISYMKAALRYNDIQQTKTSIDKFRSQFTSIAAISGRYQTQKADAGCTDSYKRVMGTFVEEAKPDMEKITLAYQKVEGDTKGLAIQLGEKTKDHDGKINTRYWEEIAGFHEHCSMVNKGILAAAERAKKKLKRKGPNMGKMALQASLIASKRKSQATEGSIMAGGEFKKKAVKIPNLSPTISASSAGASMISGFKNKKRDKMKKRHRNIQSPTATMKKGPTAVKKNMGLPKRNQGLPKRNSGLPPPPPPGVGKAVSEAMTPNTEKSTEKKRGLPRPPSSRGGLPPRAH